MLNTVPAASMAAGVKSSVVTEIVPASSRSDCTETATLPALINWYVQTTVLPTGRIGPVVKSASS